MRGATRSPLFSFLSSQTVNNTRVGNKADMGGYCTMILPTGIISFCFEDLAIKSYWSADFS